MGVVVGGVVTVTELQSTNHGQLHSRRRGSKRSPGGHDSNHANPFVQT